MLSKKIIPRSMKGLIRDRIGEVIKKGFSLQDAQLPAANKHGAEVFIERSLPWMGMQSQPRINVSYAKMDLDLSASSEHRQHHDYVYNVDVITGSAHEIDERFIIQEGDSKAAIELSEVTNAVYMILMAGENDNLGFPRQADDGTLIGNVAQQFVIGEEVFQPANADGTQIQVIGSRLIVTVRTSVQPFDIEGVPLVEILSEYCEARIGKLGEVIINFSEERNNGN